MICIAWTLVLSTAEISSHIQTVERFTSPLWYDPAFQSSLLGRTRIYRDKNVSSTLQTGKASMKNLENPKRTWAITSKPLSSTTKWPSTLSGHTFHGNPPLPRDVSPRVNQHLQKWLCKETRISRAKTKLRVSPWSSGKTKRVSGTITHRITSSSALTCMPRPKELWQST